MLTEIELDTLSKDMGFIFLRPATAHCCGRRGCSVFAGLLDVHGKVLNGTVAGAPLRCGHVSSSLTTWWGGVPVRRPWSPGFASLPSPGWQFVTRVTSFTAAMRAISSAAMGWSPEQTSKHW